MDSNIRNSLPRRDFLELGVASLALLTPSASLAAGEGQANAPVHADEIAAWDDFADQIKDAGRKFLAEIRSEDPVTRAEELRYVARLLGRSIVNAMAGAEPQPLMRLNTSDISKAGLDASEYKVTFSMIDSAGAYRLWGKLGNAHYISFQLIGLPKASPAGGQSRVSGGQSMNQFDFKPSADGAFEIMIAPERPKGWSGAWLQSTGSDNSLFGREYFDDWDHTKTSGLYIERLDQGMPPPLDQSQAASIYRTIALDFTTQLFFWQKAVDATLSRALNQVLPARSETASGGQEAVAYLPGSFKLKPDEALIVEMDAPDAYWWTVQLGNFCYELLDYVNHVSSLTAHQAVRSADGRYRVVIAQKDPGVANWLDTAGHAEGMILYRYFIPKTKPTPQARKVALSDVLAALPPDTRRVTPQARAAEIKKRRRHVAIRLAP